MPIGGISTLYGGEEIQPNLLYVNGMDWDTNSQLSTGHIIEGMFLPNVSGIAHEVNVGLTIIIREGFVCTDVRPAWDNSTSRPGGSWPERFGISRAGAWL